MFGIYNFGNNIDVEKLYSFQHSFVLKNDKIVIIIYLQDAYCYLTLYKVEKGMTIFNNIVSRTKIDILTFEKILYTSHITFQLVNKNIYFDVNIINYGTMFNIQIFINNKNLEIRDIPIDYLIELLMGFYFSEYRKLIKVNL